MFKDKKTLYIASVGMNISDISIKVLGICKKADILITDCLTGKDLITLKKINKNIKSVNEFLSENLTDSVNYISNLITSLFKKYNLITYLTYGNPLYLNKRNLMLFHTLKDKFKVETVPSVSSYDYVIDIICRKLGGENTYITYTYPIEKRLNPYNDIIIFNPNLIKNLSRKKIKTLTNLYSKKHKFYTVKIETLFEKEKIKTHAVSSFYSVIQKIDDRTTLFIPSVKLKQIK